MIDPDDVIRAAEQVTGILESRGVGAVVIGAVALAAHGYVRFTEDLDLGVNTDSATLHQVATALRTAGFEVELREPDGQDPLGGVVDVRGPFGLVQIVNYGGRFPAVIDAALATADTVAASTSSSMRRWANRSPLAHGEDMVRRCGRPSSTAAARGSMRVAPAHNPLAFTRCEGIIFTVIGDVSRRRGPGARAVRRGAGLASRVCGAQGAPPSMPRRRRGRTAVCWAAGGARPQRPV